MTNEMEKLMKEWIAYNNDGGKLTWKEFKANAGLF